MHFYPFRLLHNLEESRHEENNHQIQHIVFKTVRLLQINTEVQSGGPSDEINSDI